jgi:hypothetical protein
MKKLLPLGLFLLLVACAGQRATEVPVKGPSLTDDAAALDRDNVLVVDAQDAPDIVCRKETRPGTRIVVGEVCYPRGTRGVNAETREYLQRELSGQGWEPGWRTSDQIEAQRRTMRGIR